MSLGHYMSEIRMARSAALIHNTDSALAEIAEACGFSSAYAFSRAFKRHFRHTPSEYRLMVRQGRPPL
jgi:transcriptional regulator GlxA family with amidase domain